MEGVEVLVGLGLSGRQARVYLALLKAGDAKARVLAELAQVERQEVYGLVEDLKGVGLVVQNLTVPTSYTATPIVDGIKLLLEQKTGELTTLSKKAKLLADRLNQTQSHANGAAHPTLFWNNLGWLQGQKIPKSNTGNPAVNRCVTSWIRFKQQSFRFEDQFRSSLKKGVALRFVVEKPLNHRLPKWVKATQEKYGNFKFKTRPAPVAASVMVFDYCRAAVAFNPNSSLSRGPDLWTTNPSLIALCQAYFDAAWKQTERIPFQSTSTGL